MSVYLTIPSARPPAEANLVLEQWKKQGYKIALVVNNAKDAVGKDCVADIIISSPEGYRGYARSVNALVGMIIESHPYAEWFVAGGDDTLPDLNHTADEIAAQCSEHFQGINHDKKFWPTFGVMQPTGDRFAGGQIDRICGSPWLGREWCKRINQGRGPLWPEYRHMFVDEECQNVALKYGVLWQRPDLIHLHKHFMRESEAVDSRAVGGKQRPAFLDEANSREHWMKYEKLFKDRRAAGFPGSEPL